MEGDFGKHFRIRALKDASRHAAATQTSSHLRLAQEHPALLQRAAGAPHASRGASRFLCRQARFLKALNSSIFPCVWNAHGY